MLWKRKQREMFWRLAEIIDRRIDRAVYVGKGKELCAVDSIEDIGKYEVNYPLSKANGLLPASQTS